MIRSIFEAVLMITLLPFGTPGWSIELISHENIRMLKKYLADRSRHEVADMLVLE